MFVFWSWLIAALNDLNYRTSIIEWTNTQIMFFTRKSRCFGVFWSGKQVVWNERLNNEQMLTVTELTTASRLDEKCVSKNNAQTGILLLFWCVWARDDALVFLHRVCCCFSRLCRRFFCVPANTHAGKDELLQQTWIRPQHVLLSSVYISTAWKKLCHVNFNQNIISVAYWWY